MQDYPSQSSRPDSTPPPSSYAPPPPHPWTTPLNPYTAPPSSYQQPSNLYPSPPPSSWQTSPNPSAPYQPSPFPASPQPMPMLASTTVNVNVQAQRSGPGFLIRALYFLCIGWWLGFFWLQAGYILCIFIVTLPLGLVMLNRVPAALTLRPRSSQTQASVRVSNSLMAGAPGGSMAPAMFAQTVNVNVSTNGARQTSFLIRALYFVFIGCWLGWFWSLIGYVLCLFIVTLPIGLMMLNRLPAVLTLRKN